MTDYQKNLIYLLSCAVNGITPNKEKISAMDLETLYKFSKWHTVRAAVHIALRSAGVNDKSFHQAYNKAVRKNVMLDVERTAILEDFERRGIWYMPLKGSILKELYPENGMREMADNDMLCDASKQQEVMQIMLGHGYTAESVGKTHHDVYMKPPVLNFELHTLLFGETSDFYQYYSDPKHHMIHDEDSQYGYHLSDEDFYVYMTAHEFKHFSGGGTGIRSLLDCYVYCKNKGEDLDWNYITEQCKQLEIADFEQERRQLAFKVFSSEKLPVPNDAETELLMLYLTAGTYGTFENVIKKKLKNQSKAEYILSSMFPNYDHMKRSVPFVGKCPILYPVGIIYRWGRIVVKRRGLLKQTIKAVRKYDDKKV